jgi:hypothetical protein
MVKYGEEEEKYGTREKKTGDTNSGSKGRPAHIILHSGKPKWRRGTLPNTYAT